ARTRMADARVGVAEALGVPVSALTGVDLVFDPAAPVGSAGDLMTAQVRGRALQSRADVLSALAVYAAAQSGLQLQIARQYPDIHLGTGYQWDQGENKWSLGLSAEIPVRNRNQGPIAEAEARRAEAAARFTALQAKAIAEIDRATASRDAVVNQLKEAEQLVEAHRRQLSTLEASLKEGAADRVEVETAALELRSSELVL